MKKLIIPLFLILTLLCGCASAKKYEFGFAEGAKTPVKCSMSIPKKCKVGPYRFESEVAKPWERFYCANIEVKPKTVDGVTGAGEYSLISIYTIAKNGKETEAENVKFYTAEEMKERTVSKYGEQIVYSEDRTICGYNAFYSERIYDSPMGFANATGEISVYVSNDKTEEDDFFAISIAGAYSNETEKQEIIDAINSLEIY